MTLMEERMQDLLQEMAEAIAGKYNTPSEGTHDEARRMLLMVTAWMKDRGADYKWCAINIESGMKAKPFRCPIKREGCTKNCGDYGCGN